MKKIILLLLIWNSFNSKAQNFKIIYGNIKDSTGQPLIAVSITLHSANDTFHTLSDEKGEFQFTNVTKPDFSISVTLLGYQSRQKHFHFSDTLRQIKIPDILMSTKTNTLNEIIVKGRKPIVTLKEDTLEYQVSQFKLKENTVVEDLLKRLPGLEVDINGNIKFMGQSVTKIRINGQEIQVNNIQTLTRLIPTDLLEKVQIIDDYGELSKITGRKVENPEKVLNLQSKNAIEEAYQITGNVGIGTYERYNVSLMGCYLSPQKQIYAYNNNNNISGTTEKQNLNNAGITISSKYKKLNIGTNLNWERTLNNIISTSSSTNFSTEGNLYNTVNSNEKVVNNNIVLYINSQFTSAHHDQINTSIRGSLIDNKNSGVLESKQTGIQNLTQITNSLSTNYSPAFDGTILFSHPTRKSGRFYSGRLLYSISRNQNNVNSNNEIHYYNNTDSIVDSISNLLLKKPVKAYGINHQSSWIEPINSKANIEFKYIFKHNSSDNSLLTYENSPNEKMTKIDSLSNQNTYNTSTHEIGISIKNENKNIRYIIGGSAIYYKLNNSSIHSKDIIEKLAFSPILKFFYKIEKSTDFSLLLNNYLSYPGYQQIQSVPDKTNIQYPVIGNPKLKASSTNRINAELRHVGENIIFITTTAEFVKNKITTSTINVEDTSGVIFQETHFLNTNGNYNFNIHIGWTRMFKNDFSLTFDGGNSYTHNILYLDNNRAISKNLIATTSLKAHIIQPWVDITSLIGYTFNHNVYNVSENENSTIQSWNFQLNGKLSFKSWNLNIESSKIINIGYSGSLAANPAIINAGIEKSLLKKKISCRIQGYNLLNQVSNVSQITSGNTITQTKTSTLGSYLLLSLIYDFKKVTSH